MSKGRIIVDEMGKYWEARVQIFRREAGSIPKDGIVFLGDSITEGFRVKEYFPDLNVINRGISGDKIGGWQYYGILDRLDTSVFNLKPKALFILIGINDIVFWDTPEPEMEKGYHAVFAELKRGAHGVEIYIQSLLPTSGEEFGRFNVKINIWNTKIQSMVLEYGFVYLDIATVFMDEMGDMNKEMTTDGLHLNEKGYDLWAESIKRYVLPDRS